MRVLISFFNIILTLKEIHLLCFQERPRLLLMLKMLNKIITVPHTEQVTISGPSLGSQSGLTAWSTSPSPPPALYSQLFSVNIVRETELSAL